MTYQIELNHKPYKPQQSTSLYLITGFGMLGVGAFTFLLASTNWVQTVFHAPIIPHNVLGICSFVFGLFVLLLTFAFSPWLKENSRKVRILNASITGVLAIIFLLSQWWLAGGIAAVIAIANGFAFFYEQKIDQAIYVAFSEENIKMPATARRKQLEWTEVERVILRHGNITIDCSNNVLYQWTVKQNDIDSLALEAFCAVQIETNRSKRDTEDW